MRISSSFQVLGLAALLGVVTPLLATAATLTVPGQFPSIQAAIDAATAGDTIQVASGTYQESLDLTGKSVTLRSQNGATATTIVGTTGHVLTFQDNDRSTVVSGFTLQNPPNSTEIVHASNASPTLTDNRFLGTDGSMIAVWAYGTSLVLERNLFYGWKTGAYTNSAVSLGTFVAPIIRDNVFYNNAGGLYLGATNLGTGAVPKADIANNTYAGNGVAVGIDSVPDTSQLVFRNNIIFGGQYGINVVSGPGVPVFQNNLAYGNSSKNYAGLPDQTGTNGNISADPRLSGLTAFNFQTDAGSPAIDAGFNAAVDTGDTDFNQAQRILAGSSGKATVDIGAVEYAGTPPSVSLQLSSSTVLLGATVTVTWSSSNATSCTAGGAWSGALSSSGSRTLTPPSGKSTYTVTCSNALASRQQAVVLTVNPPPVARVTVSPATVYQGQNFTLTWSSSYATGGCTGSGDWSGPTGTAGSQQSQRAVGGTYQFDLTCVGPGGTATASATLNVISGPTLAFESTVLPAGATTRLTWTAFAGATACTAAGAWSGAVPTSGSTIVGPFTAGQHGFNLTCTAPGVSASTTKALSVYGSGAPPYQRLGLSGANAGTVTAFTSPGTAPPNGGLAHGYAYNATALTTAPAAFGQSFDFNPTGASNQTIQLVSGPITSLTILATAVNGNQPGQTFTVGYYDGSSSTYTQSMSDWHTPQNYAGETIASAMTSRITPAGAVQSGTFDLYAYRIPVDGTRFATTLKLPSSRNVILLAVNETIAPQAQYNDLGPSANVSGLATMGHPALSSGLAHGYAFNADLIPAEFTYLDQLFLLLPAGRLDAVSSATIPLFPTRGQSLTLLASGVNGNQPDQSFVVTYDDGSSTTFRQSLSDWQSPQHYAGESLAISTTNRVTPTGTLQGGVWNVYAYTFQTDPSRTLSTLTLPKNRNVVVLAVDTL